LSNFSKIVEKLLVTRLTSFFKKDKILHENQYGFRHKLSTTYAILHITNKISNNINKKKFIGLIFLDQEKNLRYGFTQYTPAKT